MARIIGITGLAGAGKDTFALALRRVLTDAGFEVRIAGFADPIRQISSKLGLDPFDRTKKETKHAIGENDFHDGLYEAIEDVLGNRLEPEERAELYAFTADACGKFLMDKDATFPTILISPREFMQLLGTEGGQRVRKTLWVDIAKQYWDALPGFVLVTDCRFPHELRIVDKTCVVVRPGTVRVNEHPSEDMADKLTNGIRPGFVQLSDLLYVNNIKDIQHLDNVASELVLPFIGTPA